MIGTLLIVILLGIIEGLTEFLPVSSTGHLLLAQRMLGIDLDHDPFWKMFAIFIQIGAIAAVVVSFRERILDLLLHRRRSGGGGGRGNLLVDATPAAGGRGAALGSRRGINASPLLLVIVGTIPVLIVGYLAKDFVEKHLEKPVPIALALGIGGLIMLALEYVRPAPTTDTLEEMTLGQAAGIGLVQVLAAVFPGTSRSAATIIGGLGVGLTRPVAAEFSFFLAIPSMGAATGYSLLKHLKAHGNLPLDRWLLLAVGTLVSFLVAWLVIELFMAYVRRRSFVPFALYRVGLAVVVLVLVMKGWLR